MLIAILVVLAVLLYLYSTWTYKYWDKWNIRTLPPVPLFGNIKDVVLLKESLGERHQQIYWMFPDAPVVGIYHLRRPTLLLRDIELIKEVLVKEFPHFKDRGIHIDERREPLTGHLINLRGSKWKGLRAKLTPAFSSGKIKNMTQLLIPPSQQLTSNIKNQLEEGTSVFEVREMMARFTTDVIGTVAFGLQFESLSGDSLFREMGRKAMDPSGMPALAKMLRIFLPLLFDLLRMRTFPQEVNSFFISVVKETMSRREGSGDQRNDFIQLMIQMKNGAGRPDSKGDIELTDEVIAAQAFVFFIAGFETSSTTLSYCLYLLSENEEAQERAVEEINRVLQDHNGELTYEALGDMEYVERILLETMRLYPPVSTLFRECTEEVPLEGGLRVEKGVGVAVPVLALHLDPGHFPRPRHFLPDRFLDKDILKSGAYLPFGAGPRVCIGQRFAMMEMKLALARLLESFIVSPTPKSKKGLTIDPKSFVMAPPDGIHLNLSLRKTPP